MTSATLELPVPVLNLPHWRLVVRPATYEAERVPALGALYELVERHTVSLRGWNFPHLSRESKERGHGTNWVASWTTFWGHIEYWRFYQSTQFLYLGSVREVTSEDWLAKLRKDAKSHLRHVRDVDVSQIPGFFSISNFIWNITEYFEFASRLAQAQLYQDEVTISVDLRNVKDFVLTTDSMRSLDHLYSLSSSSISRAVTVSATELVAGAAEQAENMIAWFFERFGWLNVARSVIRSDQQKLKTGRF